MADLQYEYILVRFGELSTKGKNKKDFIKRLAVNMQRALQDYPQLTFERTRDHIYVHLHGQDYHPVAEILVRVFGIRAISPTLKVTNEMSEIVKAGKQIMEGRKGTFKVITKRANKKFPIHSDEINRAVASEVLKNYGPQYLTVDVHDPDYQLIVEIREEATYVMAETLLGAGGYPVGVGGKESAEVGHSIGF